MGVTGEGSAAVDAYDWVGFCWVCRSSFIFFAGTGVADMGVVCKVVVAAAAVKVVVMVATDEGIAGAGPGGPGLASSTAVGGIVSPELA